MLAALPWEQGWGDGIACTEFAEESCQVSLACVVPFSALNPGCASNCQGTACSAKALTPQREILQHREAQRRGPSVAQCKVALPCEGQPLGGGGVPSVLISEPPCLGAIVSMASQLLPSLLRGKVTTQTWAIPGNIYGLTQACTISCHNFLLKPRRTQSQWATSQESGAENWLG